MSGAPDLLYVRARDALLDAAEALAEQLDAVVLVGAQAVYLHTGDADFLTAEYTTDADFCVAPADLSDTPLLSELLQRRGVLARRVSRRLAQPGPDSRRPHGSRSRAEERDGGGLRGLTLLRRSPDNSTGPNACSNLLIEIHVAV